jgi:8-oxo-dGTP diphosphatase
VSPQLVVRSESLIDGPPSMVGRVLRRSDVWVRAARAVGGRLEVAGDPGTLPINGLVRFRASPGRRPVLLRVGESDRLPVLESASGTGRVRVRVMTAQKAAGTLTSVEFRIGSAVPLVNSALRPLLIRYGEMLLGIATLAVRETVRVVAGAVVRNGKVLLARRKSTDTGHGRWELPGGKVEPGETDQQALRRELSEELSLATRVFEQLGPPVEVEPGIDLFCYRAELTSDDQPIRLIDHDACVWVGPDELDAMDLLESDRRLVASLQRVLRNAP